MNIQASTTYYVNVTAYDMFGNRITSGGDPFYIEIRNMCQRTNVFTCVESTGTTQVISSKIFTAMIDNGDGTYYYPYSVNRDGVITITVFLLTLNTIMVESALTVNLPPPISYQSTWSTISQNWTNGAVFSTISDNVSGRFTSLIKGPTTGPVSIKLVSDDGSNLYIDGTLLISRFQTTGGFTDTVTISMTQDQYVSIEIDYYENVLDAFLFLYWSYGGVSSQVIPSQYFAYPSYVGSIYTYNVTSVCPSGYTFNSTKSQSRCTEKCGDGLRVGSEVCDDGNTSIGDGCKNDCSAIEDNYICFGGSSKTIDKCQKCGSLSIPNKNKDQCISVDSVSEPAILNYIASSVIIVTSALNFASLLVAGTASTASIFNGINQMQLMLLIPLFRVYLPIEVLAFYYQISWTLFSFNFMNSDKAPILNYISSYFSNDQPDDKLNLIGVEDTSIIIDLMSPFLIFIFAIIVYLTIAVIYRLTKTNQTKCNKCISKIFSFMTFGYFIRMIIEMYFLGLICSTSEIYTADLSSSSKTISFVSSIIFWICIHCVILLSLQQWISFRNCSIEEGKYFTELFSGIKDVHSKRSFGLFSLLRKSVLIVWLTAAQSVETVPKVAVFCFFQLIYTIYVLALRPFELTRENFKDCINEIMFTCVSSIHLYFNSEETWNDAVVWIFISVIMTNIIVGSIVSCVGALGDIRAYFKSKVRQISPEIAKTDNANESRPGHSQVFATPGSLIHVLNKYRSENTLSEITLKPINNRQNVVLRNMIEKIKEERKQRK